MTDTLWELAFWWCAPLGILGLIFAPMAYIADLLERKNRK